MLHPAVAQDGDQFRRRLDKAFQGGGGDVFPP
jgi:hypothetical protein